MKRAILFTFVMVLFFTLWHAAEANSLQPRFALQTSFDFDRYPACAPTIKTNCIVGIRFYDAIANRSLATAATTPGMKGRHQIVVTVRSGSFPQRMYAVSMYLDGRGQLKEGPRGENSVAGAKGGLQQ